MSNHDQINQQHAFHENHSEPILYRLGKLNTSASLLEGAIANEERGLPGYVNLSEKMPGIFITSHVKGPVATPGVEVQQQIPVIPKVVLTPELKEFYLAESDQLTIAEIEASLASQHTNPSSIKMSEEQIANEVDEGMKDIYAELDNHRPHAAQQELREKIEQLGPEGSLEDYFMALESQSEFNSLEINHNSSEEAIQAGTTDIVSGLEDMLEQNSMEKL